MTTLEFHQPTLLSRFKNVYFYDKPYDIEDCRRERNILRSKEELLRVRILTQIFESASNRLSQILDTDFDNTTLIDIAVRTQNVILATATLFDPSCNLGKIELMQVLIPTLPEDQSIQLWVLYFPENTFTADHLYSYLKFSPTGELNSSSLPTGEARTLSGFSQMLNDIQTWETRPEC